MVVDRPAEQRLRALGQPAIVVCHRPFEVGIEAVLETFDELLGAAQLCCEPYPVVVMGVGRISKGDVVAYLQASQQASTKQSVKAYREGEMCVILEEDRYRLAQICQL